MLLIMAVKIRPWKNLENSFKNKFKNSEEYLKFLQSVILPDHQNKEKFIASTKEKVGQGIEWAKEFGKFHAKYSDGFPYIFKKNNAMHIVGGKEYLIQPEYVAYHHVRKIMRDKFIKKLRDEYDEKKPVIYLPPVALNQGESNYITRRTKIAYMVYAGLLIVRDNLLYRVRNDDTVIPTELSLQKSLNLFDEYYDLDGILIYPKHWNGLTETTIEKMIFKIAD